MTAFGDPADLARLPEEVLAEATADWTPERRAAMHAYLSAHAAREEILRRYDHPAQIAQAVDPTFVLTPAIELISRSLEQAIRQPRRNLMVTMPPQEGKSTMCAVWAPIRALQLNPDRRIILATYADGLAEDHSMTIRTILGGHGSGVVDSVTGTAVEDKLGLALRAGANRIGRWRVEGGNGGLVAVGLGASITGRPADLLIIDDPFKNMEEADSPAQRAKVETWLRTVAYTRLAPDASVILIQTRWHPRDLAGVILADEAELAPERRTWRHLNIPALAQVGVKDALNREPGELMVSARGRTAAEWETIRARSGERAWYALYQGEPAPPEGGLFSRVWFDNHRAAEPPARPDATVVAVDPAETGKGDEAGVIGASVSGGVTYFHADRSGQMTSDQWATAAVRLALELGASVLAVEAYTAATTYTKMIKDVYAALHAAEPALAPSSLPPFRIVPWRGKGDALSRSVPLRQATETGKARMVADTLADAEDAALGWQQGQHQPDRLAAMVIAHSVLQTMAKPTTVGNPLRTPAQQTAPPAWTRRL